MFRPSRALEIRELRCGVVFGLFDRRPRPAIDNPVTIEQLQLRSRLAAQLRVDVAMQFADTPQPSSGHRASLIHEASTCAPAREFARRRNTVTGMAPSEWIVSAADAGVRLDKFLAAPARAGSRGRASAALARGKVFVNGSEVGPAAAGDRVAAGDVVRLWEDRPGSAPTTAQSWRFGGSRHEPALRIVFEDDVLIVAEKPAGLLSVPLERRSDAASVYDELAAYRRTRRKGRPLVVHRIDRDTSGLVVFALRADVQQMLREAFRRHTPERVYLAVVYGRPSPESGTWRDHLVWDRSALVQKETHPRDPRGKEAVSEYRLIEAFDAASLIEVRLVTGKRNQIRLQARLRGHTLVGEQRYIYGPEQLRPISFPRQALHAHRLAFAHPLTGKSLTFEAPLPADMKDLITRLRRSRTR